MKDQKKLEEKKKEIEKIKNLLVDRGLYCSEIIDGKYTLYVFTEEEEEDGVGSVELFINENGSKRIRIQKSKISPEDHGKITIRCPPGCRLRYHNIPLIDEGIITPGDRYYEKGDVYHQVVECHIRKIRLESYDDDEDFCFEIEGPELNECP